MRPYVERARCSVQSSSSRVATNQWTNHAIICLARHGAPGRQISVFSVCRRETLPISPYYAQRHRAASPLPQHSKIATNWCSVEKQSRREVDLRRDCWHGQ